MSPSDFCWISPSLSCLTLLADSTLYFSRYFCMFVLIGLCHVYYLPSLGVIGICEGIVIKKLFHPPIDCLRAARFTVTYGGTFVDDAGLSPLKCLKGWPKQTRVQYYWNKKEWVNILAPVTCAVLLQQKIMG